MRIKINSRNRVTCSLLIPEQRSSNKADRGSEAIAGVAIAKEESAAEAIDFESSSSVIIIRRN